MQKHGYKDLAKIYDLVNQKKDYFKEVEFLKILFNKYNIKTILDVGCGTGTHMKLLESSGFVCDGIDLNQEMLDVAKNKAKGNLTCADMTNFNLGKKYDAIICMFASFNHLINLDSAKRAISCFRNNLNKGGIILIDLHNPSKSGKKQDNFNGVTRTMEWEFNPITKIEESKVIFNINGDNIEDSHIMRIYSINEMLDLLKNEGFSNSRVYENYTLNSATPNSKNLDVFAILK